MTSPSRSAPSRRNRRMERTAVLLPLLLCGCPTRLPTDAGADFDVQPCDPRVPTIGPGQNLPSCAPEAVIDVNREALRIGNELRLRVDTRNRRNELHPSCEVRDSVEAVLRYTAPPEGPDGRRVRALKVSTVNCGTQFDTIVTLKNNCGPEYPDWGCNNDAHDEGGRLTRKSTVYYLDVEPEQFVYIVVDGFDSSAGQAEVVITEIAELGVRGAPCIPVPPAMTDDPTAVTAGFRCPHEGIRCRPGAADDGTDLCLPLLPLGAPCDPEERRNVCEPFSERGVLCAQNPRSPTEAICALPGTAPGAQCRTTEPRCDGRLTCAPRSGWGHRDVCVQIVGQGAACDPTPVDYVDRCDTGLTCCGDSPDAGASFHCRPTGTMPCYPPVAMP